MPNLGNGSSDGAPLFSFGQWTPQKLATWYSTYAQDDYVAAGGDLSLYPTAGAFTTQTGGQVTGPQEELQLEDARKVGNWITTHPNENLAIMKRLNLQIPHGPNFTGDPNYFVPLWQPNNDVQVILTGFSNGAQISDAIPALQQVGYDNAPAADVILQALARYDTYVAGLKELNQQEYTQWIDTTNGQLDNSVPTNLFEEMGALRIGGEVVYIPLTQQIQQQITSQLIAQFPSQPWVQVIKRRYQSPSSGVWGKTSGAIAVSYIDLAYRVTYGDQRDGRIILLGFAADVVQRFEGVQIAGQLLAQAAAAEASQNGIAYGLYDLVSPTPISAADKKFLHNSTPHIPTFLQAYTMLGLNGFNPLGLVDPANSDIQPAKVLAPAESPFVNPDGTRKAISTVGVSLNYLNAVQDVFRSRMAYYASQNWKYNIFVNPMPGAADANGSPTASFYGALMAFEKNPDGTRALPIFTDNTQWSDLAGALKAGLTSDVQLANVFEMGILSDPALRLNLVAKPDIAVQDDFFHNYGPNNQTLYDAWKRSPPKSLPKRMIA